VPEKDLPVELPHVEKYEPTDTGESPLANISEWVNVKCPQCDGDGKRETDVMPNWAGSSWYFLRYTDPHNDNEFASQDNLKHWMPVDWYNGGMEHTTLHLLYSRFWNKFLFDIGLVPTNEPYNKRTSHGLILAEGGEKMSKSKGNVINPDDIVDRFGADTLRLYEMFMGPFDQAIAWSEDSLVGPRRFIEKIWKLAQRVDRENIAVNEISLNQVIKKVGDDIEEMKFNTSISAMMVYVNELEKKNIISKKEFETLVLLLSPFAPHVAEELWSNLDNKESVGTEKWPVYDENMIQNREVNIAIQVNGKTRAILKITNNLSDDEVRSLALNMPEILRWVKEKPQKVIVVPNKVVNIVL
jgi:leucyl-tRNA synthetase